MILQHDGYMHINNDDTSNKIKTIRGSEASIVSYVAETKNGRARHQYGAQRSDCAPVAPPAPASLPLLAWPPTTPPIMEAYIAAMSAPSPAAPPAPRAAPV